MGRASGILMHFTSLPSVFGVGDLGPESYKFAEALSRGKQHYWSILPLSPTRFNEGNSPYQTNSAFAGNPLLISPEKLVENHLLPKTFLHMASLATSKVNYKPIYTQKERMLEVAYANFKKCSKQAADVPFSFEEFCSENSEWLNDYALYSALRKKANNPWYNWPSALRKRDPMAIAKRESALKVEIEREKFTQWIFFAQLFSLKDFCETKQVSFIGDMPFYVTYDSADVWVHPELFSLNSYGKLQFVGGVPPDYFSSSGQLWGNPIYNWKKMEQTGFQWWIDRISHNLKLYDKLRLDHFRGFVAYWQVAASAKTAKNGLWVKAPSEAFFKALKNAFPQLPFIAEDLGCIDDDVITAIKRLDVPGMRVLLFAFDGPKDNPHLPANHVKNSVAFTGTHDTNTVKGWFTSEAKSKEKQLLFKLISRKVSAKDVSSELVRLALNSVADLSIIPLQDVLGLGSEARMNNPGQLGNNWEWRATPNQLTNETVCKLHHVTVESKRA